MEKRKALLKSAHPELYPDMEIDCLFIPNGEINDYIASIPDEDKTVGYKSAHIAARPGIEGEEITTKITRTIDGKEYYFNEEKNKVKTNEEGKPDFVVANICSSSENYIVRRNKFYSLYEVIERPEAYDEGTFWFYASPIHMPRKLARVSENVMIETSWGDTALVLAGGFIVTYNAEENDYNVIDEDAYNTTYSLEKGKQLIKTPNKPTNNQ